MYTKCAHTLILEDNQTVMIILKLTNHNISPSSKSYWKKSREKINSGIINSEKLFDRSADHKQCDILWLVNFKTFELFPANISLFKANNVNTRKRCQLCWKLTTKTRESDTIDVALVSLFFILNIYHTFL